MSDLKKISEVRWPQKSTCSECKIKFIPSPRLKLRQKTCGKHECLLSHRACYRRKYRLANIESEIGYQEKAKTNRAQDFWQKYRNHHPASTHRNRLNSRLRKKLKRAGLQRQLDVVEVFDSSGFFERLSRFAMSHRSLLENFSATHSALKGKGAYVDDSTRCSS